VASQFGLAHSAVVTAANCDQGPCIELAGPLRLAPQGSAPLGVEELFLVDFYGPRTAPDREASACPFATDLVARCTAP
jgi:hypothetical protein